MQLLTAKIGALKYSLKDKLICNTLKALLSIQCPVAAGTKVTEVVLVTAPAVAVTEAATGPCDV